MDVELAAPPPGPPPREASHASAVFPLDCSRCCPPVVRTFLPATWLRIQDPTHLTLTIGVACQFLLVIRTVYRLIQIPGCWSRLCFLELSSVILVFPVTFYFMKIIDTYDDRLQSKQKDAYAKKESLTKSYNALLRDMDGLLTKSAESSYGLAERSFESKRRDFQRFLERARSRYNSMEYKHKADTDQLLKQFREFCCNWLHVFEECSIDPINCPKKVVSIEELNRCQKVNEICEVCLERLQMTEVRFISQQRDQDGQLLRNYRMEYRRLTRSSERESGMPPSNAPIDGPSIGADLIVMPSSARGLWCSWLAAGRGFRCGLVSNPGRDQYPKEFQFFCGRLVVLSREHVRLLFAFVACLAVLLFEFLAFAPSVPLTLPAAATPARMRAMTTLAPSATSDTPERSLDISLIIVILVATTVTLIRFEEIDVLQQLEREVTELTKNTQQVEQQRERMGDFWSNAQQLTDLWLYRTVPRLDLYKELHSHLEDSKLDEDLVVKFTKANRHLQDLEDTLGALAAWRSGGDLRLEAKKQFGKAINRLCQEQDFELVIRKLEDVTREQMKCISDAEEAPMVAS